MIYKSQGGNNNDGYTWSGVFSIAIPEGKVQDTSENTNLAQTITMGIDMPEAGLPSTEHSTPYLPAGYTYVTGTINTGIVIRDPLGNEYVWIDVPRNIYTETTRGYDLDTLTGNNLSNAYAAIYAELTAYLEGYTEDGLSDTHLSENSTAGLSEEQYWELAGKILKSIFQNGGFYTARNEATFEEGVTLAQAQVLASKYAEHLDGYTSGLMFGLQHNLMLKSLEIKGYTEEYLTTNDTAYNINNLSGDVGFRVMLISESKETAGENDEVIADLVKPAWSVYINVNQVKKQVEVDLTVKDKFFKESNLTTNDIKIYIDGEDISQTNIKKKLSGPVPLTEKRIVDGVLQDVQVGLKYTLTLSNWEELTRREGKLYKEYSGYTTIEIAEGLATDQYGNTSISQTFNLGLIDLIKPEYTYEYSEADIDHNLKTVKLVFSVADKYYQESTILDIDDLKILIDGQEPVWKAEDAAVDAAGVKKTLTSVPITEKRINDEGEEIDYVVGYTYTLLLEELEQDEISGGKNYLDYSGVVTVGIPGQKVFDTTGNYNPAQTITLGIDITGNTGGQIEEDDNDEGESGVTVTGQYMPQNFTQVDSDGDGDLYDELDNGLVIEDEDGNQFVWVEVPKTTEVYKTAGLNITNFTDEAYDKIETDLRKYTSYYAITESDVEKYVDEYLADNAFGLTKQEYYIQKKKMLKSIYKNGGFYVGRYETGIEGKWRYQVSNEFERPVIKQNASPYIFVKPDQSQILSERFAANLEGYTSSLMFGVQWDLILKYLETKAVEKDETLESIQNELNTNSTSWGNLYNSTYSITNTKAKVWIGGNTNPTIDNAPYNKSSAGNVLLTTGADDRFSKQNIYNLAGNVCELTLGMDDGGVLRRGGSYNEWVSTNKPASWYWICALSNYGVAEGFRTVLYTDEEVYGEEPSYIPTDFTHVEGTTMDNGYVVQDPSGNQYVWVEVPKTAEVYETAGLDITEFTEADYDKIEEDLRKYSSLYSKGSHSTSEYLVDEYSKEATNLTEEEYYTQKKKMLKSVYKNGGFYVGRYEAGIANSYRTQNGDATQVPVIQKNAYPYVFTTGKQAQTLSETFAANLEGYTSSLMYGVQWNLIMKYLETKAVEQGIALETIQYQLNTDSTSWGNYWTSLYNITDKSVRFSAGSWGSSWSTGGYNKTQASSVILASGASDRFSKQNIYDLAGNVEEWTLARCVCVYCVNGNTIMNLAGGRHDDGTTIYSSGLYPIAYNNSYHATGFRVVLYKDDGTGADSTANAPKYIPNGYEHVAGTTMENGYVIKDNNGNEFVWVEVPRTAEIYGDRDAEGNITGEGILATDIDSLTGTAFTDAMNTIEEKLKAYTMTYRTDAAGNETTFTDTHSGNDATTGLSSAEYTLLKQKMLKSIFKNGGFYIARYETGTATQRTASGNIEAYPAVIKQNVYPYNFVTTNQAQSLAEDFATDGYETNLMFGVQWDLVLKYLETKGATTDELHGDSLNWGNFTGSILKTGSDNTYTKQNISDLAGNVWETTLEYYNDESTPGVARGAAANTEQARRRASYRGELGIAQTQANIGFRISLFRDEGAAGNAGQVADVVDPLWEIDEDSIVADTATQTVTMDIQVTDKYFDVNATLIADEIKIYADGVTVNADGTVTGTELTHIVKTLSEPEALTETRKINGVDTEVQYGWKYTLTLSKLAKTSKEADKLYREWSGNTTVVITKGAIVDQYTNGNKTTTFDLGHIDVIKPEFTYVYAGTSKDAVPSDVPEIDYDGKKLTVVFSVADKFFYNPTAEELAADENANKITLEDLTILIDGVEPTWKAANAAATDPGVVRTLTSEEIKEGEVVKGHTYTLVLENLEQNPNEGLDFSGVVSIGIAAGVVKDTDGNTNDATTLSIGVDETDGEANETAPEGGVVVDVVDPVWTITDADLITGEITLKAQDKFLDTDATKLENGDISVLANGAPSAITATITAGPTAVENGVQYTIKLGNITPEGGELIGFVPTNQASDNLMVDVDGESVYRADADKDGYAYYREENGGDVSLVIAANTAVDQSGNVNQTPTTLYVGKIDVTPPEVHVVDIIPNMAANTETIIFNVTDRNYDSSDLVTLDTDIDGDGDVDQDDYEISLFIDDVEVVELLEGATFTAKEIKAAIDGGTKTLGHQYTLVIKNIAETAKQAGKDYLEYSGTLRIEIAEDAAHDLSGNALKTGTTTITDFVDFAKPELYYTYSSTDINKTSKDYTMTFEVTDKYYASGKLELADLTILMQNGQFERDASGNYVLDGDGKKKPIVYNLYDLSLAGKIDLAFNGVAKYAAAGTKVTDLNSGEVVTLANSTTHQIGHTYTLTIKKLEQLEIAEGLTTSDYSGMITVAVKKDVVKDSGIDGYGVADTVNKNAATTITTGVSISSGAGSGTSSGSAVVVDVVDPRWDKVSATAYPRYVVTETVQDPNNPGATIEQETGEVISTATITFNGTDTYFDTNTFDIDDVKILVNGSEVTDGSITMTLESETDLKEDRIENGVAVSDYVYGVQYKIKLEGFNPEANQVKIRIPEGVLVDKHDNDSEETDLIVYNVLRKETFENWKDAVQTGAFLGESVGTTVYPVGVTSITHIARQDIEQIEFVDNINAAKAAIAGSAGSTVARVWDVSAMCDKSILAWTSNTAAPYTVYVGSEHEIFANPDSSYLFGAIGYGESTVKTVPVVNLSYLREDSATNMKGMFTKVGYRTMTEFDLGDFETRFVTDMSSMFRMCGFDNMEEFSLGSKFDTRNVTRMDYMFGDFGYTKLLILDLGDLFDTSNVTIMNGMFWNCGLEKMTSLNLGDKFNTANVTTMYSMFRKTGKTKMESLDLGEQFYTENVLDMGGMFSYCGELSMTTLDLGAAFTHIADDHEEMFARCGTTGLTIYAPESIYANKEAFK